jgi:hypothetical protein
MITALTEVSKNGSRNAFESFTNVGKRAALPKETTSKEICETCKITYFWLINQFRELSEVTCMSNNVFKMYINIKQVGLKQL